MYSADYVTNMIYVFLPIINGQRPTNGENVMHFCRSTMFRTF